MTRITLISIFLTLLSPTAWADEMLDKGDYTALINDTLIKTELTATQTHTALKKKQA